MTTSNWSQIRICGMQRRAAVLMLASAVAARPARQGVSEAAYVSYHFDRR